MSVADRPIEPAFLAGEFEPSIDGIDPAAEGGDVTVIRTVLPQATWRELNHAGPSVREMDHVRYMDGLRQAIEQVMYYGSAPPPDLAAAEKSWTLLRAWLSPEQLADLDRKGCFTVTGGDTGCTYRIDRGAAQNVWLLNDAGQVVKNFCFMPGGGLCQGDVMLAQKLALETRETEALRVARASPIAGFAFVPLSELRRRRRDEVLMRTLGAAASGISAALFGAMLHDLLF